MYHFGNDPLFIDRVSEEEAAEYREYVNHPAHYQFKGVEVIDLVEQLSYNLGNAVKYITRAGFKDPDKVFEDLEKAIWCIQREGERLKGLKDD